MTTSGNFGAAGPAGIETRRLDRKVVVHQLLRDLRAKVEERHADAGMTRRDLLQKVESLQSAADRWSLIAPRAEQISAMLDTLLLLDQACDARWTAFGD